MHNVMSNGTMQQGGWPEAAGVSCASPDTGVKWFAVHVRARYEKFVGDMLGEKGYETFVPLYRRQRHYGQSVKQSRLPLFPGYMFARCNGSDRLPILITPGVINLVGAGKVPELINDSEISSIKRAADADIAMTSCPQWKSGKKGRVMKGPLAGLEGAIMQCKGSFRLVLSVTLLQRSVLLEIDSESVEVLDEPDCRCSALRIH